MDDIVYQLVYSPNVLLTPIDRTYRAGHTTGHFITVKEGDKLWDSIYGIYSASEIRWGLYQGWIIPYK